MFIQQMDDIKRHGPLTSYDEDSFEKNHGRIRDQIFMQNQKARSRDTAERYAQHILCSHIVTGGFFKGSEISIYSFSCHIHHYISHCWCKIWNRCMRNTILKALNTIILSGILTDIYIPHILHIKCVESYCSYTTITQKGYSKIKWVLLWRDNLWMLIKIIRVN